MQVDGNYPRGTTFPTYESGRNGDMVASLGRSRVKENLFHGTKVEGV